MSTAGPTVPPEACSGAMYSAVPSTVWPVVSAVAAVDRAMPKSTSVTVPSAEISRLAGLTSRWTTPRRCAASSASAAWATIDMVSPAGSRPVAAIFSDSCRPSTYAITRYVTVPSGRTLRPKSYTLAMCRWLSAAMVRASARNRASKLGSRSRAGRSTLTATVRPSARSVARHTSPIPPPATGSSSRYRSLSTSPVASTLQQYPTRPGLTPTANLGPLTAAGRVERIDSDPLADHQEAGMTAKILILTGDAAESLEVMYPYQRLREEGYEVHIAAPTAKRLQFVVHDFVDGFDTYTEKLGYTWPADVAFADVNPEDYVAVVIPGGRAPEYIRNDPDCQ